MSKHRYVATAKIIGIHSLLAKQRLEKNVEQRYAISQCQTHSHSRANQQLKIQSAFMTYHLEYHSGYQKVRRLVRLKVCLLLSWNVSHIGFSKVY